MSNYKTIYRFRNATNESKVLGPNNIFLNIIEKFYNTEIIVRFTDVMVEEENPKEKIITVVFETLETIFENKIVLNEIDIFSILNNINLDNYHVIINLYLKKEIVLTTITGKAVYPRTLNQKMYIDSLDKNDIIFAVGPAGTGKTYLAVLYAVQKLKIGDIKKIVLVRPVVEAGEKLGYLPGDLKEKIDPYLIPLYDGLNEALGKEAVDRLIDKGIIEIAPLAYMRGRTLENSIIILDEAQNTSLLQMKMFLTRLGYKSKMILTGDITQIDLPTKSQSGLIEATNLLNNVDKISIIRFDQYDVMRHPLVQKIIERYESKYGN